MIQDSDKHWLPFSTDYLTREILLRFYWNTGPYWSKVDFTFISRWIIALGLVGRISRLKPINPCHAQMLIVHVIWSARDHWPRNGIVKEWAAQCQTDENESLSWGFSLSMATSVFSIFILGLVTTTVRLANSSSRENIINPKFVLDMHQVFKHYWSAYLSKEYKGYNTNCYFQWPWTKHSSRRGSMELQMWRAQEVHTTQTTPGPGSFGAESA